MKTFNLIDQPWIPIKGGKIGLADTFRQAHQIQGLASETSLVDVSLLRLLLTITQRVYPTDADRLRLWRQGSFDDRVQHYLNQWRQAFELFPKDETQRPFFQCADMPTRSTSPINKLPIHMASGDTVTFADHHVDGRARLPFDEVARNLVATQFFGLGGLTGYNKSPSFQGSPWAYHVVTMLTGQNLLQTILLNYVPAEHFAAINEPDLPTWEQADPWRERGIPDGPLDYLTWPMRRVKLVIEDGDTSCRDFMWVPGLGRPDTKTCPDPYLLAAMTHDKKPVRYLLRAEDDNANWYNYLFSLLVSETRSPIVTYAEAFCRETGMDKCIVRAVGVPGDKGRVDGAVDVNVPWSFDNAWQSEKLAMLALAKQGEQIVRRISYGYAMELSPKGDPKVQSDWAKKHMKSWDIQGRYWASLSPDWSALRSADNTDAWGNAVISAAYRELLALGNSPAGTDGKINLMKRLRQEVYEPTST